MDKPTQEPTDELMQAMTEYSASEAEYARLEIEQERIRDELMSLKPLKREQLEAATALATKLNELFVKLKVANCCSSEAAVLVIRAGGSGAAVAFSRSFINGGNSDD